MYVYKYSCSHAQQMFFNFLNISMNDDDNDDYDNNNNNNT